VSVLRRNIVANFGGNIGTGLLALVFLPLYIHFLGPEAYGLIGVFATLLALFSVLDMGLSGTLNRELARLAVQPGKAREMRDLVRTLEIPYWLAGLLIAVAVIALSPFVAFHWVNVERLSRETVRTAIMIMGLAVAIQWPIGFYSGGLTGLQRQVLLSVINVVMAAVRGVGAALVLWLMSPTAEAFFTWQIAASTVHVGLVVFFLQRSLPPAPGAAHFRRELVESTWRFAAGMTGLTVLSTILMQLDKVILSRMLSLEMFGYYSLASVVAVNLYRFVTPVFTAAYPRMTSLVALDATEAIAGLYHKSAQLISVAVLPAALVVALFSREILSLWTQSPKTAEHAWVLVSMLVSGTAIHCLIFIPYALQLAHGWTRLTLAINSVSVLLLVPLTILLTTWYGAVGGASVWVILNLGYLFVGVPLMHRRLLRPEKWRWYLEDVGRPLLAALPVALIGRYVIRPDWPSGLLLAGVGAVSGGTLLASACAANRLDVLGRARSFLATIRSKSR
jgi:O-antigen/teichoic acid export membrane protein